MMVFFAILAIGFVVSLAALLSWIWLVPYPEAQTQALYEHQLLINHCLDKQFYANNFHRCVAIKVEPTDK